MCLGAEAPPHVTLVHAAISSREGAQRAARQLASRLGGDLSVDSTGLVFTPIPAGDYYVPEGGLSVAVGIKRRAELQRWHAAAVDSARSVNATPLGMNGDEYLPHLSLCVLERFPGMEIPLPLDLVSTTLPMTLAVGELGPYGTVPVLYERFGR
jgi:hypothetical protein